MEDDRTLFGVDSNIDGEEKGDISDDKFSDSVEWRVSYHEDSDGYWYLLCFVIDWRDGLSLVVSRSSIVGGIFSFIFVDVLFF